MEILFFIRSILAFELSFVSPFKNRAIRITVFAPMLFAAMTCMDSDIHSFNPFW